MATKYPRPIYETRTERVIVGWEHRCAHCNRVFRSKRSDARYCPESSGRYCRTNAYRESKRR